MASAWGYSFDKAWGNSFGQTSAAVVVHVVGFEVVSYFNNPQIDFWRLNSPHGTAVNKFFRPIAYAKVSVIGAVARASFGTIKTHTLNTTQVAKVKALGYVLNASVGTVKTSSKAKVAAIAVSVSSQFGSSEIYADATVFAKTSKTISRVGVLDVFADAYIQVQTKPNTSKLGYAFAKGVQNPTEAELLAMMAMMRSRKGTPVTKSKPFNYAVTKKPVPDEALVALARFLR